MVKKGKKTRQRYALVDVLRCGEVRWITPNVPRSTGLIHAYVVHAHVDRERKVIEVDWPKVGGHPQVHDDILEYEPRVRARLTLEQEGEEWGLP